MIRNNLAVLMAQRGTKISKVSLQTGISRSTLNSIAQNESKMIQLETINLICQELGVTPCEFFSYLPYDVSIKIVPDKIQFNFNALISDGENVTMHPAILSDVIFEASITKESENVQEKYFLLGSLRKYADIFVEEYPHFAIKPLKGDDSFFEFWETIPTEFQVDIKTLLKKIIIQEINSALIDEISRLFEENPELFKGLDSSSKVEDFIFSIVNNSTISLITTP